MTSANPGYSYPLNPKVYSPRVTPDKADLSPWSWSGCVIFTVHTHGPSETLFLYSVPFVLMALWQTTPGRRKDHNLIRAGRKFFSGLPSPVENDVWLPLEGRLEKASSEPGMFSSLQPAPCPCSSGLFLDLHCHFLVFYHSTLASFP